MVNTRFVDVPIRSSRYFATLLISMHALAASAILVLPIPLWVRLIICALLIAQMVSMVRKHALVNTAHACIRLRVHADGECELQMRKGGDQRGHLRARWLASPLLIAIQIRFTDEWLPRNIALLPDSSDSETLRRLRVFLRFGVKLTAGNK